MVIKKTQITDLFANIKKTIVSFVSIVLFITCGMGIYIGFDWSNMALRNTAHENFEKGNLHDLEIYFPYGISEDDLNEIKKIDGVDVVEGQFYAFELFNFNEKLYQAKIVSLTDKLDQIVGIKGRLPKTNDEIVINQDASEELGIIVGDTIKLNNEYAYDSYIVNQIKTNDNFEFDPDLNEKDISYLKEK